MAGSNGRLGEKAKPSPMREVRVALGLRQYEVAALSGVPLGVVRRVEQMRRLATIRLGDVLRIAWALGVAPTDLVPGLAMRPEAPRIAGAAVRVARRLAREARGPLSPDDGRPAPRAAGPVAPADACGGSRGAGS